MQWTDEYRGIVEFYYWEPQHIGRAKGIKRFSNANQMLAHINRLEVSLNHVLNIFFSLFDINKLDCFDAKGNYTMLSAPILAELEFKQHKATQPDMFFEGDNSSLAIELKLRSKSSLEQIKKYVNFNKAVYDEMRPLNLIYLTPAEYISKIFAEKYVDTASIYNALGSDSIVNLKFVTYKHLYISLKKFKTSCDVEARLVNGLLRYLEQRNDLELNL